MSVPFPATCPNGIPADPDIAGIGVRIAVYIQALLCLWPVTLVLAIPLLDMKKLKRCEAELMDLIFRSMSSISSLAYTSLALFLVSVIRIAQHALAPYHAIVILNLSWIIFVAANENLFTLGLVLEVVYVGLFTKLHRLMRSPDVSRDGDGRPARGFLPLRSSEDSIAVVRTLLLVLRKLPRFPTTLFALQPIATGIMGLLLSTSVESFASPDACPGDTVLWTFGTLRRIASSSTQRFWWRIYIVTVIPCLSPTCTTIMFVFLAVVVFFFTIPVRSDITALRLHAFLAFLLPAVAFTTVLIVSTEHTARENPVQAGEGDCGFGQVLALVLIGPPLYDLFTIICDLYKLGRKIVEGDGDGPAHDLAYVSLPGAQPSTDDLGAFQEYLAMSPN